MTVAGFSTPSGPIVLGASVNASFAKIDAADGQADGGMMMSFTSELTILPKAGADESRQWRDRRRCRASQSRGIP